MKHDDEYGSYGFAVWFVAILVIVLALIGLASAVAAQESDCNKTATSVIEKCKDDPNLIMCLYDRSNELKEGVKLTYNKVLEKYKDKNTVTTLISNSQEAWKVYHENWCAGRASRYEKDIEQNVIFSTCLIKLNVERGGDLYAMLNLED